MQPVGNAAEAVANNVASAAQPAASGVEDPTALLVATGIIIVGGLVGGYAAALTANRGTSGANGGSRSIGYYLMLGVVASGCVPLFLSLTRSVIMSSILKPSGDRLESYLVFGGLCLIAGYTAQSFITSISRRVLQQVEEAREDAKEAKETAQELAEEHAAEPISQARLEQLSEAAGPQPNVDMTDKERAVLSALTRMSFRTATGAATDAGISRMAVGEILDELAAKGLAEMTYSPNTKRIRWAITPRGIGALKAS